MKISTRARYITRALLDLASHHDQEPVSLKDIAQRQQISQQYLEHLITPLISAGIVYTTRGPRGGISLARLPQQITLSEIFQILEGSIAPVECVDNPEMCSRNEKCVTRDVWIEMKNAIFEVLKSTTLQALVERHKLKEHTLTEMYHI